MELFSVTVSQMYQIYQRLFHIILASMLEVKENLWGTVLLYTVHVSNGYMKQINMKHIVAK